MRQHKSDESSLRSFAQKGFGIFCFAGRLPLALFVTDVVPVRQCVVKLSNRIRSAAVSRRAEQFSSVGFLREKGFVIERHKFEDFPINSLRPISDPHGDGCDWNPFNKRACWTKVPNNYFENSRIMLDHP